MTQETQEIEQEVQPQATEESVASTTDDTANQEGEQQQQAAKTFTQEDVDKIVSKEKSKLERKLQRHERENLAAQIRAQVLEEVKQQFQPQQQQESKPQEENYSSYGEYLEALADWKADQKLSSWQQEQSKKASEQREQQEKQTLQQRTADILKKGNDKYDDFEDVLQSFDVELSQPAFMAITESDVAEDVAYYLATHEAEAKRIAALSPYAQAKEIGKLEVKLTKQPAKQISQAPDPIKPVTSGKAANDTLSDSMSMDDWMAARNKQLGRRQPKLRRFKHG